MNQAMRQSTHTVGDYAYDAIYVGGIGGGLVAMFFLVYDIATREAFFTPSLMGSVLFDRIAPETVATVNMMAVAKYSVAHFVTFGLLGLGISILTHQAEIRSKHPLLVVGLVFVILEAGFWLAASVVIPGVLQRLGAGPVAMANLLAAVGIAMFLVVTHRPDVWLRVRRALRLA